METPKYTILGRGERYLEETGVGRGFGEKRPIRSFEQAAELLLPQVRRTLDAAEKLPVDRRLDEIVVELRMHRDFIAKTYQPRELLENAQLTVRGTGRWVQTVRTRAKTSSEPDHALVESKTLFVSGRPEAVRRLASALQGSWGGKGVRSEVTRIEEIRLPEVADRVRGEIRADAGLAAVELVLFQWDRIHREEAIRRISRLARNEDLRVKRYIDGPTFIAAAVTPGAIAEIEQYNYLRAARPLPRVELTRTAAGVPVSAPMVPPRRTPDAWVAVFDGGFALPHPHLDGYVIAHDETTEAPRQVLVEHGTAVCSAALYGAVAPGKPVLTPEVGIYAFRVLPDPRDQFELYGVIDTLERVVPSLPAEVKVVNLSLGPAGPIDDAPSRFTYAIDRLAYETERLFFVAVGNWGEHAGYERIQVPSDSVNSVAVGAWEVEPSTGAISPASYSCMGPGRNGCKVKPDVLMNGGSAAAPFYVFDAIPGALVGTFGTSYAAPQASATAARLLSRTNLQVSTQAVRALMLNACSPLDGDADRVGWGTLSTNPDDIIRCGRNHVSVLYEGVVTPRGSWKLPFFVPPGLDLEGNVQFGWTFVFAPDVDGNSYDEYTRGGLEIRFRANIHVHRYSHPTDKSKFEILHGLRDTERIADLMGEGWTKSLQPAADSRRAKDERSLRAAEAKWDTVLRGRLGKNAASIEQPFVTVSMLGRGEWDHTDSNIQARFAAVLTVQAPKYSGDLYEQVTHAFVKLQPLRVRVPVTVQVT